MPVTQPSPLYRLLEAQIEGSLLDFVASRRATASWREIATELTEATDTAVSPEALRLWFADRLEVTVEVKVA